MTDAERLALAHQAKTELPACERAIRQLEAQTMREWVGCTDPTERERMWHRLNALGDIYQMLVAAAAEVAVADYRNELADQGFQP